MFGTKPKENPNKDFDVFVIYDSKVEAYGEPMFSMNEHDMVRQVTNTFRADPNNKFLVNAEDYSIYKIGSYTKKTGELVVVPHTHIANFHDLRSLVQKDSQKLANYQSGHE